MTRGDRARTGRAYVTHGSVLQQLTSSSLTRSFSDWFSLCSELTCRCSERTVTGASLPSSLLLVAGDGHAPGVRAPGAAT